MLSIERALRRRVVVALIRSGESGPLMTVGSGTADLLRRRGLAALFRNGEGGPRVNVALSAADPNSLRGAA